MKNVQTLVLLTFLLWAFSTDIFGQEGKDTSSITEVPYSYQVAFGFSDIFFLNLGVEASFKIAPNHYLGGRLSSIVMPASIDPLYQSLNWGAQAELVHRYYIPNSYGYSNIFYFLRSSASFTGFDLNYTKSAWFPISENGNELLNFETRNFSEVVYRGDVGLALGMQVTSNGSFFGEIFAGLRLGGGFNRDNLEAICLNCDEGNFSYFSGSYVLPFLGINLGFGATSKPKN